MAEIRQAPAYEPEPGVPKLACRVLAMVALWVGEARRAPDLSPKNSP